MLQKSYVTGSIQSIDTAGQRELKKSVYRFAFVSIQIGNALDFHAGTPTRSGVLTGAERSGFSRMRLPGCTAGAILRSVCFSRWRFAISMTSEFIAVQQYVVFQFVHLQHRDIIHR